jgi:hypothetical protein
MERTNTSAPTNMITTGMKNRTICKRNFRIGSELEIDKCLFLTTTEEREHEHEIIHQPTTPTITPQPTAI